MNTHLLLQQTSDFAINNTWGFYSQCKLHHEPSMLVWHYGSLRGICAFSLTLLGYVIIHPSIYCIALVSWGSQSILGSLCKTMLKASSSRSLLERALRGSLSRFYYQGLEMLPARTVPTKPLSFALETPLELSRMNEATSWSSYSFVLTTLSSDSGNTSNSASHDVLDRSELHQRPIRPI